MSITLNPPPTPSLSLPSVAGGGVVGQIPTAGSPLQTAPSGGSWFARNKKLVGAVAGGVLLGALGFVFLGPLGAAGGAVAGAVLGSMLVGRGSSQPRHPGGSLPYPPFPPR